MIVFSKKRNRGLPKYCNFLNKSKGVLRYFLRNPWKHPLLTFNYAAIRIQCLFRGYILRKYFSSSLVQRPSKNNSSKRSSGVQLDKYLKCLERYHGLTKPVILQNGFSGWCIVKIQSFWRMSRIRHQYGRLKSFVFQISALVIQTTWKTYKKKIFQYVQYINPSFDLKYIADANSESDLIESSAKRIQIAWRSFCNKR